MMKYEFFFYFLLLIISLRTAPASPICFQSKLALRFIFGIEAARFSHYSCDNERGLQRQRAITRHPICSISSIVIIFLNISSLSPFLHWILNCCPQAVGAYIETGKWNSWPLCLLKAQNDFTFHLGLYTKLIGSKFDLIPILCTM